ncbi:hydroxyacylglutathione hydrolase, mitochondrial [Galendromus occidentalis]|uniref:hydroxyacylglutathione hydrolase n=1 Tax=Galendromus occidentalis TaxID=34638 RepID=A0AAJ6QSG1_9ACAR|nr:hydroxyacylglutathione hydrolase, mitochondrial [Galendromus occidentalis]
MFSRTAGKLQPSRIFRCLITKSTLGIPPARTMADVTIIGALDDNYMYLITCPETKEAAIVDPVNPEKVLETVEKQGVNLTTVLTTHHHWDHAGGNEKLLHLKPGLKVYGGDHRIKQLTDLVNRDEVEIKIGALTASTRFTPCHTTGHVCFYIPGKEDKPPVVFTGDTLFLAGCGKFFEGTAAHMQEAMDKLGQLPDDTLVYCGHEYTVNNLKFAQQVESDNQNTQRKLEWAIARRSAHQPTIPSTIAEEKTYNPFMRTRIPAVQKHASQTDAVSTMDSLRCEKDNFRTS